MTAVQEPTKRRHVNGKVRAHATIAPQEATKPILGEVALADPYRRFGGPGPVYNQNELFTREGLRVVDKMRRDDQVKAALTLKKLAVLSSGWTVTGPDDTDDEWAPRRFVEEQLNKLRGSTRNALAKVLSALDYGFSWSEQIYTPIEDGEWSGLIGLSALKTRRPHEVTFHQDQWGNITALEQGGQPGTLPIPKFLIFVYDADWDDPYGTPDLSAAHKAWWVKSNVYTWQAMMLERWGVPPIFALYDPNVYNGAQLDQLKLITERLQPGTAGIIPRKDPEALELWAPELAGQVSTVFQPALEGLNRDIARAILMPGLLGMTPDSEEGSFARSKTQFDVFMLIVGKLQDDLADAINEQVIARLCDFNFPGEPYPTLTFNPIESDVRADILDLWMRATQAGVVSKLPRDEIAIREQLDMPEASEDEIVATRKEEADAALEQAMAKPANDAPPPRKKAMTAKRQPNRYEQRIDFASVSREMRGVESAASERIRAAMTVLRDKFVTKVGKSFDRDLGTIKSLKLPAPQLKAVSDAIGAMLTEAFERGGGSIRREIPEMAMVFAEVPNVKPASALRYLNAKTFWITGVIEENLLRSARAILFSALDTGESAEETMNKIGREFDPYVGDTVGEEVVTAARLETIVRTNVTDAYNRGRLIEARELGDLVEGYEYSAIMDDRTTEICSTLDGKVFRSEDPDMDRYVPPLHFNCRSLLVPIVVGDPIDRGDLVSDRDKGIVSDLADPGFGGGAAP